MERVEFPKKEYLVGVSYFNGWWEGEGNGWHDWLAKYPGRKPLLGQFLTQETMNREIIAASDHGVDSFQILWYPCYNRDQISDAQAQHLNEGVKYFMASPENNRMRFSIEYCNHAPFAVTDDDKWKQACAELVSYMKHPSYLRVGAKAVLKIHTVRQFLVDCENDMGKAVSWIKYLRDLAGKEGVGDLLLGTGSGFGDDFSGIPELMAEFDYVNFYMSFPFMDKPREEEYSYALLIEHALNEAKRCADNVPLPCLPYVPSAWNPKPWTEVNTFFTLPSRAEWNKALSDMKKLLDQNIKLRLPDGTEGGQKMLNIYCWNEYGEGGIVSPTEGDGYMKLEEIQKVFK